MLAASLRLLSTASGALLAALYATGYDVDPSAVVQTVVLPYWSQSLQSWAEAAIFGLVGHDDPNDPNDPNDHTDRTDPIDRADHPTEAETSVQDLESRAGSENSDGQGADDGCLWWAPEQGKETDTLCGAFALRRLMTSDTIAGALERATACAAAYGVSCVLSHEVRFQVPAAMVWDVETMKMRMFLLPHIHSNVVGDGSIARRVALVRPTAGAADARPSPLKTHIVHMNRSIVVDHVDKASLSRERVELHDENAYCLQTLVMSIPAECHEEGA